MVFLFAPITYSAEYFVSSISDLNSKIANAVKKHVQKIVPKNVLTRVLKIVQKPVPKNALNHALKIAQ